jgi:hypothetical protein
MPNLLFVIKRGPGPKIYQLPGGETIWPGVLPPFIFQTPENRIKERDKAVLRVLASVHESKDELPETLRGEAEKFIESGLEHLSHEYGDELTIFFPSSAFWPQAGAWRPPSGPQTPTNPCQTLVEGLFQEVQLFGEVP